MRKALVLFIAVLFIASPVLAAERAPDFTVHDVSSGNEYTLSSFRGKVVLIDFMAITCEGCDELEESLKEVWPEYNDSVIFISLDVAVATDSPDDLRAKALPWIAGMDNESVYLQYGVSNTPTIVIVDSEGYAVFKKAGVMSPEELRKALDDAIAGRSGPIDIPQTGIYLLALFAGIASFFSPCSFPMLPGYMAYYFGIGKKDGHRYRKAAVGGFSAAMGIVAVYLIIGALLIYFGSAISEYIPAMGLVVGILLIILGILMFTPIQYDALVEPFRKIGSRFKGKKEHGFAVKLFGYGVGYGAAAAGCTAPLFIAVILGAMAIGLASGITALLIYTGAAGILMVAITLSMAAVENRLVDVLKRNTERIKWVSAVVLIIVGAYLVWYHLA